MFILFIFRYFWEFGFFSKTEYILASVRSFSFVVVEQAAQT